MKGYIGAVAFATGLALVSFANAAFAAPELLSSTDRETMRINEDAFNRGFGSSVALTLPDGNRFSVLVQTPRLHKSGNVTWTGHMVDGNGQDGFVVTLTSSRESGMFGTILSPTGEYRVEPAGDTWGEVKLTRVQPVNGAFDNDVVVFDEFSGHYTERPQSLSEKQGSTKQLNAPSLYNVLILYTNSARGDMDDAAWQAYLDNLLMVTNAAYEASGTNIEFNLAGFHLVAADESASNLALLRQMRTERPEFNPDVFGAVSKWRVESEAHFVTLLRETRDGHGSCGYGHLPNVGTNAAAYSPRLGFSTVSIRGTCLATTLAHELGHNLGSAHEKSNGVGSAGAFAYSNAYSNSVPVNTIMATADMNIPRVAKFSSPRLDCNGAPCGVAGESENARSLYEVRPHYDAWLTDRAIELKDLPMVRRGAAFTFEYNIAGLIGDSYILELHKGGTLVDTLVSHGTFLGESRATMPADAAPGTDYTLVLKAAHAPEIYGETAVAVVASDIHAFFYALEAGETAVRVKASVSHDGVPYTGTLRVLDAADAVVGALPLASSDASTLTVSGLSCATTYSLAADITGADGVPAEIEFETADFTTDACGSGPVVDSLVPTVNADGTATLTATLVTAESVELLFNWGIGSGVRATATPIAGAATVTVTATDLSCGTDYVAQVASVDGASVVGSELVSFSSPACTELKVGFTSTSVAAAEGAAFVALTVTLSAAHDRPVSVSYATRNGSAKSGTHYTGMSGILSWKAGESGSKTVTVPIVKANAIDEDRTFAVALLNGNGVSFGASTATVTIAAKQAVATSGGGSFDWLSLIVLLGIGFARLSTLALYRFTESLQ